MSLYLGSQTIKAAVDRLAVSTANSSLADYLIFRRALRIATDLVVDQGEEAPGSVVTGTKAIPFVRAVQEMTLCIPASDLADAKGHPYYSPFGALRDSGRGYKSVKYPSNGASDTVSRWQSRGARPLVLVDGTSPKEFRFEERTREQLEDFFHVKSAQEHFSGNKPALVDVAIWWFRGTDLGSQFSGEPTEHQLVASFVSELGLTDVEVSAFFAGPAIEADVQAEPQS
jgi:hypothetical protein